MLYCRWLCLSYMSARTTLTPEEAPSCRCGEPWMAPEEEDDGYQGMLLGPTKPDAHGDGEARVLYLVENYGGRLEGARLSAKTAIKGGPHGPWMVAWRPPHEENQAAL